MVTPDSQKAALKSLNDDSLSVPRYGYTGTPLGRRRYFPQQVAHFKRQNREI
jgi:hypothetical protein